MINIKNTKFMNDKYIKKRNQNFRMINLQKA